MTPENVRFHAAGHLAAAALLAGKGQDKAMRMILDTVVAYVDSPSVKTPPAIREQLQKAKTFEDIALLEEWFVHPFNTVIEQSGA